MARGEVSESCTVTNMSRAGALVQVGKVCAHMLPALGVAIVLEIDLAAVSGFAARCLHCEGTVVRVSKSLARPVEIGVRVSRMEFRNAKGACVRRASPRRWLEEFGVR